ncbi:winged helix-turn-helix domain-containing protein [Streptomyces sp. NBC_01176]|uniref:helix-turn-helix domain-containing protein n=1 Tax=Streptomyces sp. NBC_01176 TaxID=2903760 RepID=UPI00386A2C70|nr:winged helix-turn-helix domain-containing protein [Streptomyces sp. NBC_01176]
MRLGPVPTRPVRGRALTRVVRRGTSASASSGRGACPSVRRRFASVRASVASDFARATVSYTVEGTWRLKRHGWSRQQPTRRAIERDDDAVEVWKKETWPRVRASRRSAAPGLSSRTRPGSR